MKYSEIFTLKQLIEKLIACKCKPNNILLEEFNLLAFRLKYMYSDNFLIPDLMILRARYEEINEKKVSIFKRVHNSLSELNIENFTNEIVDEEINKTTIGKVIQEITFLRNELLIFFENVNVFYGKIENEVLRQEKFILTQPNFFKPTISADDDRHNRKIIIDDNLFEQISSKIRKFTDWKYPTLEIGPGDGKWTDNLVGSDPLYLLDIHKEYLDKVAMKYPKLFSDRIRCYCIGPENNKSYFDFSNLPNNQIGFIFSWGVFDFYTYNEVDLLLSSCHNVLRPGGELTFSYNDCDYISGIKLFEENRKTWLTQNLLLQLFEKYKFTVVEFECNSEQDIFWVTVQKTGKKQSIKTSQPRTKLDTRKGFEKFDNHQPLKYNKQQIARIKQLAIKLGVDTDEKIMSDAYDPHILMELVNLARMNK